jgi:hypothetical protein
MDKSFCRNENAMTDVPYALWVGRIDVTSELSNPHAQPLQLHNLVVALVPSGK